MTAGAALSPRHTRALDRFGDLVLPGDETYPSFSRSGCAVYAAEALEFARAADVRTLRAVLTALGVLPLECSRWLLGRCVRSRTMPMLMSSLWNLADHGLIGVVKMLYFSGRPAATGPTPVELVGHSPRRPIAPWQAQKEVV